MPEAQPSRCPSENTVVELLEADLAPERRAVLGEHVDQCASCRELVAVMARTHMAASSLGQRMRFTRASATPGLAEGDLRHLDSGDRLGRYVIEEMLGQGGMGVVYAARDPELDRRVAVKVIRPGLAAYGDMVAARLSREARAMAQVAHPNVIAVYDVGTAGGQVFVAMELAAGQTLRAWLRERPRPWRQVLDVFRAAGEGLAAAHAARLVHRDFKPDNVLIDPGGRVRVTDFGLARALAGRDADEPSAGESASATQSGVHLTRTGATVGTPAYMAPEQHTQMPTDERTDQFSFSVALWEALFAERPFAGDSPLELAEAVVVGRIRPMPRRPRLPGWLRRALRRGLAISPGDRFPTMRALLDAIRPRRSRVRLALAAAALVVLTGGVAFALQADDEAPDDCAGQRGKLEAVWNPERRAHLRARLAAGPQGAARASLVEQALDRYAAGWQRMAADACTAGQRGAESAELIDLRAHCLDTRLADLQQVIALLDTSDPLVADNAVASVDGLAPVERCSAVEVVEARVPVPSDPADRARVEELRRQLVRADALRLGGRYGEARALLEDLDRRAAELGYRPLVADVLYYLGALQVSTGRAAGGEATLRRAAHAAEASRYDQLAADAWILLIETATQSTGDLDKAAEYAEHARAALDRLGSPARLQGQFEHHLGILSWARSRLDEALANFTSARRRLEQIGEAATALAADEGIGLVYEEQGKLAESLEVKQRVLAAREKLYGADHPDVAISLNNMASTLMLMGRSEEALAAMQRVLSIRERANGPEHLETGQALHNMGELLRHLGRYAEALDHHRRARAIFERDSGPENQIVAQSLENTAGVYLDMGQVDEALPRLRRALAMYRKALGDENLDTVRGLINLADGLREAGQFGEALALDQEAVATLDRASGLDTMHGAHAHFGLGLDLLGLGRAGEARPPLERAATTLERIGGDPIALAQAHFGLARALWRERGERPRARELAESALRALDAAPGADPRLRAKVSAWMRTHAK